jgi:hypothetical protein
MADGLSAVNLANAWLNVFKTVTFTGISTTYVQLHTGPPGASGTSNVSSVTTRMLVTFGTPSGGAMAESNTPTWSSWAGTNGEIVTDISVWSASTSGTFYFSVQLSASATMTTGATLQITSFTFSLSPIAA